MSEILTPHLALPLPHPDHELAEDVLRIRESFMALDQQVADLVARQDSSDTTLDTLPAIRDLQSALQSMDDALVDEASRRTQAISSAIADEAGQRAQAIASAVAALVNASPAMLDTLNELAAALGNDPNFAATLAQQLSAKADRSSTYTRTEVDAARAEDRRYKGVAANYTAAAGERIAANSSSGPFVVQLPPAPAAGDTVWFKSGPAATATPWTVGRNGKSIEGAALDLNITENRAEFSLTYDGATWRI